MQTTQHREGAVGALLDIYEQAISDLKVLILDIPEKILVTVFDATTEDEDCRSIQTVLSHVVDSGYGYATSIYHLKGYPITPPPKVLRPNVGEYLKDLGKMFTYTENIFADITDSELEQTNDSLKISTEWGQLYDIEQMTEHAIVHILRHKQQIKRAKQNLMK